MKRIISLFLAVVMITSITAGIDFTAQAKTRDEYFADFDGRVSGLIAELAPTLAGVKYNKSDIITGYDGKISDYYYSYLDGTEEDKLDFYQLYQLCKENKVDKVIYGHLHGKNVRVVPCVEKDGIPYYLTSADLVHFKLTELY